MSERILLVEDDESNRITLAALLEDEGFVVDEEGSCRGARARLASGGPVYQLVILDQNLGDGMGAALVPEVRARMPAARVILLSGNLEDPGVSAGFDASLAKGESFPTLLALLAALPRPHPPGPPLPRASGEGGGRTSGDLPAPPLPRHEGEGAGG